MKNLNSYITESIIGSNNAGVFSEEVFNRLVREKFEDAFKNLVNFKHMYKDPLDWSDMGSDCLVRGWAITINKSGVDIEKEFLKNIEKFTKAIKQYKPLVIEDKEDIFEEGKIESYEIRLQEYPNNWYDEPRFYITFAEDVSGDTHSRYWLLIGYDDTGMDDIFNPENT